MNQLPPFYVGQRVVVIVAHPDFEKGREFLITGILQNCCGWVATIGIINDTMRSRCMHCNRTQIYKGEARYSCHRFAPIESTFTQISYERVMELESPSINAN